jgi:hypothetical protein
VTSSALGHQPRPGFVGGTPQPGRERGHARGAGNAFEFSSLGHDRSGRVLGHANQARACSPTPKSAGVHSGEPQGVSLGLQTEETFYAEDDVESEARTGGRLKGAGLEEHHHGGEAAEENTARRPRFLAGARRRPRQTIIIETASPRSVDAWRRDQVSFHGRRRKRDSLRKRGRRA